jgi:hypothetical protein
MARRFVTNIVPQGADRERAVLFTSAKKKLSHASRHADPDALEEVRKSLAQLQALLGPGKERDDDEDAEDIDNEDEGDEEDNPKADKDAALKAMTSNRGDAATLRGIANARGQHRSRRVENDERSSGNPIVDGMNEHRGDDAVLRNIANHRASQKRGR